MSDFLVFAGTTEGRRLIEYLAGCGVTVCASVATEYGKTLLPDGVGVFAERMEAGEMTALMSACRFDCVIDATHPYATMVTDNIKAACLETKTRYLRLSRPSGGAAEGCVYVESAAQAADVIAATTGNVLLTTGSKELEVFTHVDNFRNRIFPRVLPALESIQRCLALGYHVKNIVAMQGPFSRELNAAMMRQLGISILVTKEAGDAGGFSEKLAAAHDAGATAIVIGRPREEAGMPYEDIIDTLTQAFSLHPEKNKLAEEHVRCFPMFVKLAHSKGALIGGGHVAARRAAVLAPFGVSLTVIAPQCDPRLEPLGAAIIRRPYQRGDCAGFDFVLAATDSREVNHAVFEECKAIGIPVNVADNPLECSFYFPAVVQKDNVVIGVTASGTDHKLAMLTAQNIREHLEQILPQRKEECHEPEKSD